MGRFEGLDELVDKIGEADWKQREVLRDSLLEASRAFPDPTIVISHLEQAKRRIISLEARWEVDEVIEALTPPPEAEEEEEEAPDPNKPLSASDLTLVYDDPRGIRLHKSKVGERFFLTQVDPQTYRPQTFELQAAEIGQLKQQLNGSPYWVLGSGGAAALPG